LKIPLSTLLAPPYRFRSPQSFLKLRLVQFNLQKGKIMTQILNNLVNVFVGAISAILKFPIIVIDQLSSAI